MALNYVTLILDLFDGSGNPISQGAATFTPSVQLTDSTDQEWIPPAPVQAFFRAGLAAPQVVLLATDNANVLPSGWGWQVTFQNVPGNPAGFSFFLPFSAGATQHLSKQAPVASVVTMQAYMPLPGGAATAGYVPIATGIGEASNWGSPGSASLPLTTLGDMLYENATPTPARLPGSTSATKNFLTQTGTGTVSAAPAWGTIAAGDVPVLNQNTTGSSGSCTGNAATATSLAGGAVATAARTVTTNYTAVNTDSLIEANASGGAVTITLPTSAIPSGLILLIKKIDSSSNTVTIAPATGQIDGHGSYFLPFFNHAAIVQWDGSTWNTVSSYAVAAGPAYFGNNVQVVGTTTFGNGAYPGVAALTDAATIAVNAQLGNAFNLTLSASGHTLGNPSNPVDGQVIRFRITQGTGGSFTLSYGTAYDFGAGSAPTLSTAAAKVDVLGFEYVASISKWCYLGSGLGF